MYFMYLNGCTSIQIQKRLSVIGHEGNFSACVLERNDNDAFRNGQKFGMLSGRSASRKVASINIKSPCLKCEGEDERLYMR